VQRVRQREQRNEPPGRALRGQRRRVWPGWRVFRRWRRCGGQGWRRRVRGWLSRDGRRCGPWRLACGLGWGVWRWYGWRGRWRWWRRGWRVGRSRPRRCLWLGSRRSGGWASRWCCGRWDGRRWVRRCAWRVGWCGPGWRRDGGRWWRWEVASDKRLRLQTVAARKVRVRAEGLPVRDDYLRHEGARCVLVRRQLPHISGRGRRSELRQRILFGVLRQASDAVTSSPW